MPLKEHEDNFAPASPRHPLLVLLEAEAHRRGENLRQLASHLSVEYRTLARWRSGEANIERVGRETIKACSIYLNIPVVLVLNLAGIIKLEDLQPPELSGLARTQHTIRRLRMDPRFAGMYPPALDEANAHVQKFIGHLYDELNPDQSGEVLSPEWVRALSHVLR